MHLGCVTTLAIGSNDPALAAWTASLRLETMNHRAVTSGTTIRIVFSSSRAELPLQRERSDAFTRRREHRVGERGCRDGRARLADPAGRLAVSHEVHLHRRRLIDPQHANVMEVRLLDPAILERDLAPQGTADAEHDAALDLRPQDRKSTRLNS